MSSIPLFECEQKGHEYQATGFNQMVDSTTLEVEYECLNCGLTQYDYVEPHNI